MVHALLQFISLLHLLPLHRISVSELLNSGTDLHCLLCLFKFLLHFSLFHDGGILSGEKLPLIVLVGSPVGFILISRYSIPLDHVCVHLFLLFLLIF